MSTPRRLYYPRASFICWDSTDPNNTNQREYALCSLTISSDSVRISYVRPMWEFYGPWGGFGSLKGYETVTEFVTPKQVIAIHPME